MAQRQPTNPDLPKSPVGASLLAKASTLSTSLSPDTPPSLAGKLPQWPCGNPQIPIYRNPLWERACSRRRRHIQHLCRLTHRHRLQASSHNGAVATHKSRSIPKSPVGASLLAKASTLSTSLSPDPPLSLAGKLPQWPCGNPQIPIHTKIPCGSEPAREGVGSANISGI